MLSQQKKSLGANVSQAIRRASRPLSLSVKGDLGDLVYLLAMIYCTPFTASYNHEQPHCLLR